MYQHSLPVIIVYMQHKNKSNDKRQMKNRTHAYIHKYIPHSGKFLRDKIFVNDFKNENSQMLASVT